MNAKGWIRSLPYTSVSSVSPVIVPSNLERRLDEMPRQGREVMLLHKLKRLSALFWARNFTRAQNVSSATAAAPRKLTPIGDVLARVGREAAPPH